MGDLPKPSFYLEIPDGLNGLIVYLMPRLGEQIIINNLKLNRL